MGATRDWRELKERTEVSAAILVSYPVHHGGLHGDFQFPSSVLHWVSAAPTPLRTTDEEKHRSEKLN